jgi:hypothetical protein
MVDPRDGMTDGPEKYTIPLEDHKRTDENVPLCGRLQTPLSPKVHMGPRCHLPDG